MLSRARIVSPRCRANCNSVLPSSSIISGIRAGIGGFGWGGGWFGAGLDWVALSGGSGEGLGGPTGRAKSV